MLKTKPSQLTGAGARPSCQSRAHPQPMRTNILHVAVYALPTTSPQYRNSVRPRLRVRRRRWMIRRKANLPYIPQPLLRCEFPDKPREARNTLHIVLFHRKSPVIVTVCTIVATSRLSKTTDRWLQVHKVLGTASYM